LGLQISLGLQQQLIVLVMPLPLGLHLSPLGPSIIINGSYTNDQPCLYNVLGLFKSASGHGPFKCFMVLALSCVLIKGSLRVWQIWAHFFLAYAVFLKDNVIHTILIGCKGPFPREV